MKRLSVANIGLMGCLAGACARDVGNTAPLVPARPYDRSCQADAECVPAPACCPAPCTEDVVNVRDLQRARADLRCDGARPCPSAGGCITFAYLCVRSECKIVFANDEDYRSRTP